MKNVNEMIAATSARRVFHVSGQGLAAAVVDTGINSKHLDFSGRIIGQVNFTPDNDGDPNYAHDGNGNGTGLAGVIAANGDHTGIAPEANIVALKVLRDDGAGSFEWMSSALAWVLDNHQEYGISVVCLALGDDSNLTGDEGLDDDAIRAAIRALHGLKVPVVVAAGNNYAKYKGQQGMSYPAVLHESVSVGAVYAADAGQFTYGFGAKAFSTRPGQIAPFSQRLHDSVSPASQTDIFAPGAPVTAPGHEGEHGESTSHGTTRATAVVAGVILLMQELHREISGDFPEVDDIVRWLRQGSAPIYDGDDEDDNVPNTHLTYPLVDVMSALYQVRRALVPQMLNQMSGPA